MVDLKVVREGFLCVVRALLRGEDLIMVKWVVGRPPGTAGARHTGFG